MPMLKFAVDSIKTFYYFIHHCPECNGWHIVSNNPDVDGLWIYEGVEDAARDLSCYVEGYECAADAGRNIE
jgi:hypothetical protein